jgi:MOSC domain-containing protein YiiM
MLVAGGGARGDSWERGARKPDAAVSVMRDDVALLMANGQDPALGGDNLRVDLDLHERALPVGTRLRVGAATCRVSNKAHNGCRRFAARFGTPARELPLAPEWAPLRLRGVFFEVLVGGEVRPGDAIEVLSD